MKIGDRVKATSEGHSGFFKYDRDMKCGEEGIITKIDECYLEITSDDGTIFSRICDFVKVIKPKQTNPNDYEIYG